VELTMNLNLLRIGLSMTTLITNFKETKSTIKNHYQSLLQATISFISPRTELSMTTLITKFK